MRSPREQFKNAVLNYLEEEFEMMQKPGTPQERLTVPRPVKYGDMVKIRRGAEQEARDKDDQDFAANRKHGGTRDDHVPSKNPMRRGSAQNRGKKDSTTGNFSESFKGQIKNAVLNYLEEQSAQGERAGFDRKATQMAKRGFSDPNAEATVAAQARSRTNQKRATQRFGAGAYAGAGNKSGAQAASNRQMRQTSNRFQTSEPRKR